jgi:uncharacterized protein (TIGR03435 family)
MIARFFLPLLAFAVPGALCQFGLYGPVTTRLKAGDFASDIQFAKVLSAPGGAQWHSSNLTGQLTILIFYLNTSRNLQTITMWNSLVDAFASKGVQFLFISGEKESTLLPWLSQHPIKGWVFHDPDGETGKAYGLEEPATVFIGSDGKIIGFGDMGFPPEESQVRAAIEGRITTTRPTRATMKAFLESGQVVLNAEPSRMPRADEHKPNFPPSYTFHVSPSQGEDNGNSAGHLFKSLRGYTIKEAITNLYGVNPIRVYLPTSLDNGSRYDFDLVLPEQEDQGKLDGLFKQGLSNHFHFSARRENRAEDVYVVTSLPGRKPPSVDRKDHDGMGGGFSFSASVTFATTGGREDGHTEMNPVSVSAIRGVSMDGTADQFCHLLEKQLDRAVVNETRLDGEFEFHLKATQDTKSDFQRDLRDRLGLAITPAQRNIDVLVIESN